ncbi:MAG: lysostaphin resistance A-like protein [Candidatus Hodarchaeales archaeon]
MVILSQIILFVGILSLWKKDNNKLIDLGFRRDEKTLYLLVIGVIEATIGISVLISGEAIFRLIIISAREFNLLMLILVGLIGFKILVMVMIEEICFRGYFLQVITKKYSSTTGLIVSSILWAFLHIPNMVWKSGLAPFNLVIGLITLFLIGLALGLAYLKTKKSLWFGLSFHFSYNLVFNMINILFFIEENAPDWLLGQTDWFPESGLIGLVFALLILILTYFVVRKFD